MNTSRQTLRDEAGLTYEDLIGRRLSEPALFLPQYNQSPGSYTLVALITKQSCGRRREAIAYFSRYG